MQTRLTRLAFASSGVPSLSSHQINIVNARHLQFTTKMASDQSSKQKVLQYDNINPNVRTMEYAVRGPSKFIIC